MNRGIVGCCWLLWECKVTWICDYIKGMRGIQWFRADRVYLVEIWILHNIFVAFCFGKDWLLVILWWESLGRLKWHTTGFDAFVWFFSTSCRWPHVHLHKCHLNCITCTPGKKIYVGQTGRWLADHFHEELLGVSLCNNFADRMQSTVVWYLKQIWSSRKCSVLKCNPANLVLTLPSALWGWWSNRTGSCQMRV